ncbi:hypothetical protein MTYP_03166 [Methylophilaceae bacterium]|nr:hypothetical protein MTYP_03166 [Methylophilaceae bacterium]
MVSYHQPDIVGPYSCKQHGGVLMVMLLIMIVGAATLLVSSLGSSAITIERDKTTANALAQAKEALVGRALADDNHPGSLPCPDVDDDGKLTMNVDYVGSTCTSPIGRLPWITLGLPELRDGAGEHLWYTVSKTFAAIGTPLINSDTQGTLSISGTSSASNVIAIVFAPSSAIQGDNRSPSATATCSTLPILNGSSYVAQSLCATNYLEGNNAAANTWATPNLNYHSSDTSSTFNDRMISITHKDLMPLIEKRIAREVKGCLDGYASDHSSTYPWATPVDDTTNYAGAVNTLFGRLPTNATIYNANVQLLLDDIAALQIALDNYSAVPNSTTRDALIAAGFKLDSDADSLTKNTAPPLTADDLSKAKDAGGKAQPPHIPAVGASNATVKAYVNDFQLTEINLTLRNFAESGVTPGGWPVSCTLFSSSNKYWGDWKTLVFYQIASGYAPGGSVSCDSACLTISGTGNTVTGSGTYRAAIAVAGKMKPGQTSRNATLVSDYLELLNQSGKADIPTNTSFETYKTFDAQYQTVNDLVLCLDGGSNCK